jgi:hypothetical protein
MPQWQVPREEQTIEDLRPGYRRFNWVWYHPLPASRLPDMLRGADGVQYEVSIPLPQVRQGQRKSDGQSSQCSISPGANTSRPGRRPIAHRSSSWCIADDYIGLLWG